MSSTESTKAVQKRAKFCLEVLWLAWQYRLGKTKCKYFNNQNYNFKALSQLKMDRNKRKLNCFYSIFAKKCNSHCHFLYVKTHKIIRYYKWRGGGWVVQKCKLLYGRKCQRWEAGGQKKAKTCRRSWWTTSKLRTFHIKKITIQISNPVVCSGGFQVLLLIVLPTILITKELLFLPIPKRRIYWAPLVPIYASI